MTKNFDRYFQMICENINRRDIVKLIRYHQNKIQNLLARNYEASPVDIMKMDRLKRQAIHEYITLVSKNHEELVKSGLIDMVDSFAPVLRRIQSL